MFAQERAIFAIALIGTLLALASSAEAATLFRTWVSNTGDDGHSCDISAPCQTFNGAYANTTVGGEITCLNDGNYGVLNIEHSLTVNCQYSIGGLLTGNGVSTVSISAGAGSVVTLRGLDFDFAGETLFDCPGGNGTISFTGGGVLHLQKMKINHYNASGCSGVLFAPSSDATLDVSDSDITDNGNGGTSGGVNIAASPGVHVNVTVTRTQIQGNYFGIICDGRGGGTIHATISDSVVSGNAEDGITALSSGSSVVLTVDQTKVAGNLAGLFAGGSNAGILARNSTVFNNTVGLDATGGGTLYTYGNNSVNGNTTNGAFTGSAGLQ
jgi:hypothetical protein